jgi:hypothetical protein
VTATVGGAGTLAAAAAAALRPAVTDRDDAERHDAAGAQASGAAAAAPPLDAAASLPPAAAARCGSPCATAGTAAPLNLQRRSRARNAAAREQPRVVAPEAAAADSEGTPRQDDAAATPTGGTVHGQGAGRHGATSGERREDARRVVGAPGIRCGDDGLPLQAPGIVHHLDGTWTDIRSRCLAAMDSRIRTCTCKRRTPTSWSSPSLHRCSCPMISARRTASPTSSR